MILYLSGHNYHFECENLCRVFFPYSPVKRISNPEDGENADIYAKAVIFQQEDRYLYEVWVRRDGREKRLSHSHIEIEEYLLTNLLYTLFSEFTGYKPEWGMLTGIHPVKLLREYSEAQGEEAAVETFKHHFHVSEKNIQLSRRILGVQQPVLDSTGEKDFCLYIGIPFCPTRCSYCSFVSQSIEKSGSLINPYFELLLVEIDKTAALASELGLKLRAVYIGGGTPTTLSAVQLELLCRMVKERFDFSSCSEFTVEAGRPDTIDREKLISMKNTGVTRISINPQSMSEKVLKLIGRTHTGKDIENAFRLARETGFTNINSDLIVGLPGDDMESFGHSLKSIIDMGAGNITVHSLALKRASEMTGSESFESHKNRDLTKEMFDYAYRELEENGFWPYYLYRQTRMAANMENTGWCVDGQECVYNIYTMDESVSIIACGTGGVTKLKSPNSNRLERIFNFKNPHEYISRHSEILSRKDKVKEIYEQFCQRIH